MYIQLTFIEKKNNSSEPISLPSTTITLSGEPALIEQLPAHAEANKRVNVIDGEDGIFNYFIDCETADVDVVKKALELFAAEYDPGTEKRFLSNIDTNIIPAVIIMKSMLQRALHPDNSNNDEPESKTNSKGKPSKQPTPEDKGIFSYVRNSNLLFSRTTAVVAGTVAVAAAAAVYFTRRND